MIKIARKDTKKFTIPDSAEIENVKHLASYNWVEKPSPTIVVPGSPSLWLPLNSSRRVAKDSGLVYINQNAARHPERPLEPLFRALFVSNPSFDIGFADIVTDRNNLRKLLKFMDDTVTGDDLDAFVIQVEHIHDTAMFLRVERSNSKHIKPTEFIGYGHEFEKAQTRELIPGSTGHHRIVAYDLGGLNLIVRHETDGYEDEEPEPMPLNTAVKASEDNLSSAFESLSLSSEKDTDGHGQAGLVVLNGGRAVPIEQTLEIKTRVSRKPIELEDVAPQLWLSQIPKLVRAYHQSGRFQKTEVEDVAEETKAWEKSHQPVLRRLVGLLQEVRIVTKECGGKATVTYDSTTEKLCISKKPELDMLPEDIRQRWTYARSTTSTSPQSEKVRRPKSNSEATNIL